MTSPRLPAQLTALLSPPLNPTPTSLFTLLCLYAAHRRASHIVLTVGGDCSLQDDGAAPTPEELRALWSGLVRAQAVELKVWVAGEMVMDGEWLRSSNAGGNQPGGACVTTVSGLPRNKRALPDGLAASSSHVHARALLERASLVFPHIAWSLVVGGQAQFKQGPFATLAQAFRNLYSVTLHRAEGVDGLWLFAGDEDASQQGIGLCVDPHDLSVPEDLAPIRRRLPPNTVAFCWVLDKASWATKAAVRAVAVGKADVTSATGIRPKPPTLAQLVDLGSLVAMPRRSRSMLTGGGGLGRSTCLKVTKEQLSSLRYVGQLNKEFLLATSASMGGRLLCFDQHAAHERVRLEQFLREFVRAELAGERPVKNTLRPSKLVLASRVLRMDALLRRGWDVIWKGGFTYEVRAVPSVMGVALHAPDVAECDGPGVPRSVHAVLASKACRGAVFFGRALSPPEAEAILRGLVGLDFPFQCAHGRPSVCVL